ncbi:hypothetical protein FHU37_004663 [Allostreptomyces psammosilenae]|uniref:Uncharacterized protein n=1 Tax=Allostreptomyces psammosilenae TaxID=1892865 RepID=A0A853A424_9ACTN|nr:hypothetical protein [Allostreptomyces psammosilenae]
MGAGGARGRRGGPIAQGGKFHLWKSQPPPCLRGNPGQTRSTRGQSPPVDNSGAPLSPGLTQTRPPAQGSKTYLWKTQPPPCLRGNPGQTRSTRGQSPPVDNSGAPMSPGVTESGDTPQGGKTQLWITPRPRGGPLPSSPPGGKGQAAAGVPKWKGLGTTATTTTAANATATATATTTARTTATAPERAHHQQHSTKWHRHAINAEPGKRPRGGTRELQLPGAAPRRMDGADPCPAGGRGGIRSPCHRRACHPRRHQRRPSPACPR